MKCKHCRFYKPDLYKYPACTKIEMANNSYSDMTEPGKVEITAQANDDTDLEAYLKVTPDFGCSLFEPIETKE